MPRLKTNGLTNRQMAKRIRRFTTRLETFVRRHPESDATKVDMGECRSTCGSPGCHGGWAGVVLTGRGGFYKQGAFALAKFLGFSRTSQLEYWADSNRRDWGNDCGILMFSASAAFNQPRHVFNTFSVRVIIRWWNKVASRLERKPRGSRVTW